MKKQIIGCLAVMSACVSLKALPEGVDSVSGDVLTIDPIQGNLNEGEAIESNSITQLMFEGTSTIADDGLTLYTDASSGATTTLAAGTQVNSYIFHFDPSDDSGALKFTSGSATFSNTILGFVASDADLSATDYLGNATTIYPTGVDSRGAGMGYGKDFFGTSTGDTYSFSGDTFTIDQLTVWYSNFDQVRVLTAVPEPSTIAGIGLGVLALGFLTYKRRKNTAAVAV